MEFLTAKTIFLGTLYIMHSYLNATMSQQWVEIAGASSMQPREIHATHTTQATNKQCIRATRPPCYNSKTSVIQLLLLIVINAKVSVVVLSNIVVITRNGV